MKKQAILLISILLATVLTACSGSREQSSSNSDQGNSNSESSTIGKITYKGATSGETFFIGLDGKPIDVSEITALTNKKYEPTAVLDKENFSRAECNGFAYAFEPNIMFEEKSNPELFANGFYVGEETQPVSDFVRVNVGDKFNGLTVKTAKTVFNAFNSNKSKGYYEGSELEFDGELVLTGWLTIPPLDDKYPDLVLDMTFDCDADNKLPLSSIFCYDQDQGFYHCPSLRYGIFSDIPTIFLGEYRDCNVDFQGLTEGDTLVRVQIIVSDLKMVCGIQGDYGSVTATLVDVKLL